jgi:DDE superfamily endonuclease
MAGQDVGEGTRLAAATGAYICFEDEAGQNLRPPKARTWARRGRTPVVMVSGKGSGRVSVAGLVCLRPGSRSHLFYRIRIHRGRKGERRSMSEADYAELIAAAHNQLGHAPVILIWDNLNTHISAAMHAFIQAHPDWLTEVRLPAYAPRPQPRLSPGWKRSCWRGVRKPSAASWAAIAALPRPCPVSARIRSVSAGRLGEHEKRPGQPRRPQR